jgi:hypothetical protein
MNYENFLVALSDVSPKEAYNKLLENPNHEYKFGYELIIKKDPNCAYLYAKYVIKGRWKEGEETIKKNPQYAIFYAQEVIGDRNFWWKRR